MNNNLANNNDYAIEMFNLAEVYQNIMLEASSITVPLDAESGQDAIDGAVSKINKKLK